MQLASQELPKGKWFCCVDCKRIYSALQNSLNSGEEKLSESCLGVVRMKLKEKRMDFVGDLDVRWRLISGKITSRETRVLLAEAVSIFHVSCSLEFFLSKLSVSRLRL